MYLNYKKMRNKGSSLVSGILVVEHMSSGNVCIELKGIFMTKRFLGRNESRSKKTVDHIFLLA